MSEDNEARLASYLKDHPRMMGVLFTSVMLLSQAGTVAAGGGGGTYGP